MENTGSLLFDNTDPKYFVVSNSRTIGPLTAQELYERIEKHETSILDYFWKDGQSDWKRIQDEKEFAVLLPQKPPTSIVTAIKAQQTKAKKASEPPPVVEDLKYYLYFNRTQYGPFSRPELVKVLESHRVDSSAYLWIQTWPNWKSIKELPDFFGMIGPDEVKPAEKFPKEKTKTKGLKVDTQRQDRRAAPRKPLIARLFVSNNEDVIIAVCRDISIGGMQVLTDRIPGEVGSKIKLNVSPSDAKNVKGFVAEGELVRVLEDGRGFSFRFTKLSGDAKKAIEKYIA